MSGFGLDTGGYVDRLQFIVLHLVSQISVRFMLIQHRTLQHQAQEGSKPSDGPF